MSENFSLNEYKDKINESEQKIFHEFEITIKTATFLFDQFSKLRTFLRFTPTNPDAWSEKYTDDELDLSRLSGNYLS